MKEPGRELDAEIAEKVMGIIVQPITSIDGNGAHADVGTVSKPYPMIDGRMGVEVTRLPDYSTDIAAAWLVVEKLKKDGRALRLTQITARGRPWRWEAEFYEDSLGSASTAPHAICLAALAAIGEG